MHRIPLSRALPALAALLSTRGAFAQESPDEVVRRDLIAQAERARLAGDHALAVERAGRAALLRATPSIQYFLAREHEALGHALDTLVQASACARGAEADPALRSRDVLLRACRAIVARTEGRLGHLTVRVAGPLPDGATLRVAGNALAEAVLGVPYPVEPGTVRVEASAPGHEAWGRDVAVAAGESVEVAVSLVPTPRPVAVLVAPRPPVIAPTPAAVVPPSRSAVPLLVGGAAGLASFVAAGALYAVAMVARGDRDGPCGGAAAQCDLIATEHDARYRSFVYATDVALGVGAAALVAGGLVWWFARPAGRAPAPPRVVVAPAFGGRGGLGVAVTISL